MQEPEGCASAETTGIMPDEQRKMRAFSGNASDYPDWRQHVYNWAGRNGCAPFKRLVGYTDVQYADRVDPAPLAEDGSIDG